MVQTLLYYLSGKQQFQHIFSCFSVNNNDLLTLFFSPAVIESEQNSTQFTDEDNNLFQHICCIILFIQSQVCES